MWEFLPAIFFTLFFFYSTDCILFRTFSVFSSVWGGKGTSFKIALLSPQNDKHVTEISKFNPNSLLPFSCHAKHLPCFSYRHRRDCRTALFQQLPDRQGGRWPFFFSLYPRKRYGQLGGGGRVPFLDLWSGLKNGGVSFIYFFFPSERGIRREWVTEMWSWEGMRGWRWKPRGHCLLRHRPSESPTSDHSMPSKWSDSQGEKVVSFSFGEKNPTKGERFISPIWNVRFIAHSFYQNQLDSRV